MGNQFEELLSKASKQQSPEAIAPQDAAASQGVQPQVNAFEQMLLSKSQQNAGANAISQAQAPEYMNKYSPKVFDMSPKVEDQNGPTPLSAVVHGVESGYTYNFADDVANLVDPEAKARFLASKKEYPITYGLSNLLGALISPNPASKLTALKNAGLALKAAAAIARPELETGVAAYGASDKQGLDRLKDAGEAMKNPLTIGLSLLSGAAISAPTVLRAVAGKEGRVAEAVGKASKTEDALSSTAGQEMVTRAANTFADDTTAMIKQGRQAMGQVLDDVVSKNAETTVDAATHFKSFNNKLTALKDDHLDDVEKNVKAILSDWAKEAEGSLAKGATEGNLGSARFSDLYAQKRLLGSLIHETEKMKFSKAGKLKAMAMGMYKQLNEVLNKADVTENFKDASDAYNTLMQTQGTLKNFGTKVMSMDNKMNASALKASDGFKKAWNNLPTDLRTRWFPSLDQRVNQGLDELVSVVDATKKAAGRSPNRTSFISDVERKLPIFNSLSPINLMNRVGRESAGVVNPVLTNWTSRGLSNLGRIGPETKNVTEGK